MSYCYTAITLLLIYTLYSQTSSMCFSHMDGDDVAFNKQLMFYVKEKMCCREWAQEDLLGHQDPQDL